MNLEPRVVCAAVKMKDGAVIVGIRHLSPDMRAVLRRIYGPDYKYMIVDQGFVNTWGDYLTREEAWVVAEANGQIRRRVGGDDGKLFSENLY